MGFAALAEKISLCGPINILFPHPRIRRVYLTLLTWSAENTAGLFLKFFVMSVRRKNKRE